VPLPPPADAVHPSGSLSPAKVRFVDMTPGAKITQAGGLVLAPRPGVIDVAFMRTQFTGEAVIATVRLAMLAAGDPGIRVERVDARNGLNHKLLLPIDFHAPSRIMPRTTALALAAPNPFRGSTTIYRGTIFRICWICSR